MRAYFAVILSAKYWRKVALSSF